MMTQQQGSLFGNAKPLRAKGARPKQKVVLKNKTPKEWQDQALLCKWMDAKGYVYFAVPNDGERTIGAAIKAAATGLKKGVPDLCIPMPRSPYHGLFLELKRAKGGTVSAEQEKWIGILRRQGYRAEVCRGYDAAVKVLEEYFHAG